MTYKFRPAERSQAKPLIGIYSESGAGKTYGALLLARGFVGPKGKIGMIETESGRGEAYADPKEYPEIGGYDVLPLRKDFSPKTYGEAITVAEDTKLDALIIDSASHEWEGAGGVLSMAALNQEQGKKSLLVWQIPKMEHQQHFMLRFMQCSVPLVILCMRAKYPMREVIVKGEKKWARSEMLDPKQSDDVLFEMFIHGWISQGDHAFHLTKCSSKTLEPLFSDSKPITLKTGQDLAAWAAGSAAKKTKGTPAEARIAGPNDVSFDWVEAAFAQARHGEEAFTAWWQGEGKPHRKLVKPHLAELQKIAEEADAEPDDPFASEADKRGDTAATTDSDDWMTAFVDDKIAAMEMSDTEEGIETIWVTNNERQNQLTEPHYQRLNDAYEARAQELSS